MVASVVGAFGCSAPDPSAHAGMASARIAARATPLNTVFIEIAPSCVDDTGYSGVAH
jgi:hypothetical protein